MKAKVFSFHEVQHTVFMHPTFNNIIFNPLKFTLIKNRAIMLAKHTPTSSMFYKTKDQSKSINSKI